MRSLKKSVGALDADSTVRLVSLATDIAVMVDRDGVVRDLSIGSDSLSKETDIGSWVGRKWIDTVTVESRPKIEQLLKDASVGGKQPAQWRQVNHPAGPGRPDLPVRYATMHLRPNGPIMALGRELRSLSVMQQRLIEAQQAMEREYARVRYAETRYRLLFQVASEAVLILDAATLRVTEVNPAAERLIGPSPKRIAGKAFIELVESSGQMAVQRLIDALRSSGKADAVTVKLAGSRLETTVSGSLFKQEASSHLLMRLSSFGAVSQSEHANPESTLRALVERMPDAFVVTDPDQRILTGNAAFLDLAQLVAPDQLKGQPISRWIGRSPTEVDLLIGSLREHGSVRKFPTIVRGELGGSDEVEISAVAVDDGQPSYGFTIRGLGRRDAALPWSGRELPHSVNQLTGLVGQVPLKNLVRETTDLIERMCIEAALQIVGDNRASAAEMLGLSRQSLYMKLRRYGLGDLGPE